MTAAPLRASLVRFPAVAGVLARMLAVRRQAIWIGLILLVAWSAHAINMFDYPFYENDEGTYMSQAWALLARGELAPYTYWYDHAPFGWIQIAGWTLLTGGFYTFGTSVESGRVMMLVYQVASTLLVYLIARRVSGSGLAGSVAALAFALSVYGIYFHRRVLLDNLCVFWSLLSLYVIVSGRMTLWRVWAGALCLGLAVLSKEVAVFLLPGLAYLAWYRAHPSQRMLAVVSWTVVSGSVISLYVLMAVLRGELFPAGSWLGGSGEHVSLLGSVSFQAARENDGGLFEATSAFWRWASTWAGIDPLVVVGGTLSAGILLLSIRIHRITGVIGILALSMWLFLARGGVVIEFYLLPVLPFLCLSLGLAVAQGMSALRGALGNGRRRRAALSVLQPVVGLLVVGGLLWGYVINESLGIGGSSTVLWTSSQAEAQRAATRWIMDHTSPGDSIVVDAYQWTDLHDPATGQPGRDLAHWYWKVDLDPDVRDEVFANDWRNLDYVVTTPQMQRDVAREDLALTGTAIQRSAAIASWDTDGWEVSVHRVNKVRSIPASSNPILGSMWQAYKAGYLEGGRVIDRQSAGETTSEGQSYAMLQAVYMRDRVTFDRVWDWTQKNLQSRDSALVAWQWGERPDGETGILDASPAADADQDIALALLFAARGWGEATYVDDARAIIDGIWRHETALIDNQRVLMAGPWARGDEIIVNPSYLNPAAYRIFAEVDPAHDWMQLVDSSYAILDQIAETDELGGAAGAVPNWVAFAPDSFAVQPSTHMGPYGTRFSFDASRVPWRIGLDWIWNRDPRATQLLSAFDLPTREIERTGRLAAEYELDGSVHAEYESISMYAGVLPGILLGRSQDLAHRVLATHILAPLVGPDARDVAYYDSNWAWFATAFLEGGLSNIWAGQQRVAWPQGITGG